MMSRRAVQLAFALSLAMWPVLVSAAPQVTAAAAAASQAQAQAAAAQANAAQTVLTQANAQVAAAQNAYRTALTNA